MSDNTELENQIIDRGYTPGETISALARAETRAKKAEDRNAQLASTARAILKRHGPIETRSLRDREYLSPAGIMVEGVLLKALYEALAANKTDGE